MSDTPEDPAGFDPDHYTQVQAKLRQLKAQLPEASVANLAREVIRQMANDGSIDGPQAPGYPQIAELCEALVAEDDHAGARYINEVRSAGATIDSVYLNYLAGAARLLGTWWEDDKLSFSQVAVGTSRMYAIMRSIRRELPVSSLSQTRAAVFATVPGEEHILGVRMAADLFRKDGWDIELLVGREHDALVSDICKMDMVLVGLSASGTRTLETLSKLVIALRIKKPALKIFVSGHVVDACESTVSLMDIDGMAADYETAKHLLESHAAGLSNI